MEGPRMAKAVLGVQWTRLTKRRPFKATAGSGDPTLPRAMIAPDQFASGCV